MSLPKVSVEPVRDVPQHAHKAAGIMFDAVKSFIGGGMSFGRSEPASRRNKYGAVAFRFQITASYYDEEVVVQIDVPDVKASDLIDWHDWDKNNALTRQKLLLLVDGKSMPFSTALAFTAIQLGEARRKWEKRHDDAINADY